MAEIFDHNVSLEYRLELLDSHLSDCPPEAANVSISIDKGTPGEFSFELDQMVSVDFHAQVANASFTNMWEYLDVRDENGAPLFLHYDYDDRFMDDDGSITFFDDFTVNLRSSCRFETLCYDVAERYRVVEDKTGLNLGEFESTEVTVDGRRFRVFVTSARRQAGFKQGDCFSGHASVGTRLMIDIVAQ